MVLFFTILAEVPQVQWLTNDVPSQEGKWSDMKQKNSGEKENSISG